MKPEDNDDTLGKLFWENVDDCLKKYKMTKADFCRLIYDLQEKGVYRKSWNNLYHSLKHFVMNKNSPNNNLARIIKKAIIIIDTENEMCPVEYSDLITKDFFKE